MENKYRPLTVEELFFDNGGQVYTPEEQAVNQLARFIILHKGWFIAGGIITAVVVVGIFMNKKKTEHIQKQPESQTATQNEITPEETLPKKECKSTPEIKVEQLDKGYPVIINPFPESSNNHHDSQPAQNEN